MKVLHEVKEAPLLTPLEELSICTLEGTEIFSQGLTTWLGNLGGRAQICEGGSHVEVGETGWMSSQEKGL